MLFTDYLKTIGDVKASELFKVKPRTVGSWRRKERYPKREKALEIVELTRNKVKLKDIYV